MVRQPCWMPFARLTWFPRQVGRHHATHRRLPGWNTMAVRSRSWTPPATRPSPRSAAPRRPSHGHRRVGGSHGRWRYAADQGRRLRKRGRLACRSSWRSTRSTRSTPTPIASSRELAREQGLVVKEWGGDMSCVSPYVRQNGPRHRRSAGKPADSGRCGDLEG